MGAVLQKSGRCRKMVRVGQLTPIVCSESRWESQVEVMSRMTSLNFRLVDQSPKHNLMHSQKRVRNWADVCGR